MTKTLTLLIFCFFAFPLFSQIVNIESQRYKTDTIGWEGNYNLGFTFGKQKEKYFAFSNAAHVQYKSKKSLYLILGSLDILKSGNNKIANSGFFHFRYNYKIRKWLRWEAFSQVQYNKLTGLRMRFLLGTGPRFKLVEVEKIKSYLGTLYMLEYEINNDKTQKLVQGRFSGYLSFSFRPIKTIELISTTYYQPRFDDIKDYRISTDNALFFRFHKILSFGLNYKLTFDTRPPQGSDVKLIYQLENKFKIDF